MKKEKTISLKEFQKAVNGCVKYAGKSAKHVGVEIWLRKKCYRIKRIGQFGIIPTMTIDIEPGDPE